MCVYTCTCVCSKGREKSVNFLRIGNLHLYVYILLVNNDSSLLLCVYEGNCPGREASGTVYRNCHLMFTLGLFFQFPLMSQLCAFSKYHESYSALSTH